MPAALVAVLGAASCTAAPADSADPAQDPVRDPAPEAPATGAESPPRPDLSFRLARLSASAVDRGRVPRKDLAEPAAAVRRSIEGLYRAAFVEPDVEAWEQGDYTELFSHLSAPARERASSDLGILTLGPAAARVDVVEPTRAIVRLRFLYDRHERPVVALADTEFDATAIAGGTRRPITHRAEYTLRKLNGAWRVVSYDVRARVPRPEQGRVETGEAAFAPGVPGSDPLFILVIGSDARPRQSMLRTRADSIHIVAVEPGTGRVSLLGIPRDSWVPIPGWGTDKINAALVRGGPALLVDTVERLSGIRIDAYVLTGFHGFSMMVDAIGGIEVDIPYPIQDALAKAWFREGSRRLNGAAALAFSRARHDVPGGDFGRSLNQGRVLVAALATLREHSSGGATALLPWVIAGANHVHSDLGLDEMFGLALAATAYEPGPVRNAVASGHTGTIGGKSVVILDAGAQAAFRDLARDGVLGS